MAQGASVMTELLIAITFFALGYFVGARDMMRPSDSDGGGD